jgi:hypothetical protein
MAGPTLIDPRARKILFDAYWSATGWKVPRREPTSEDFAYAKSRGVMFDRETLLHDGAVRRIVAAKSAVQLDHVVDGFTASLGSRQLQLRPSLASFFQTQGVECHRQVGQHLCAKCDQFAQWEHDFSATNFARIKWGTVPRLFPVDHAFVLERFALEGHPPALQEDREILSRLLSVADSLPADRRARDLEQSWRPMIRSTREERDAIIEVMVCCKILVASRYTAADVRQIPTRANWSDGAALWRGADGVNREQAKFLFDWP